MNPPNRKSQKSVLFFILRIIISVSILYALFTLVRWHAVIEAFIHAQFGYVLAAFFLLFVNVIVRIVKWKEMLKSVKEKPTWRETSGSFLMGLSFGSFTPGEVGEYAGRTLHITDTRRSHIFGLALLDKLQIFVVSTIAGVASLALLLISQTIYIYISIIASFVFAYFVVSKLSWLVSLGHTLNLNVFRRSWVAGILDGIVLLSTRQMFLTLLFTFWYHFIIVLQMYLLINAFDAINIFQAFVGTSAMLFSKSFLPISLSDLGIREAASIFFFSVYHISQSASLNASLLLFVFNILIPSMIGTLFLTQSHLMTFKNLISHLLRKNGDTLQ